jgi:hypothetical protein
MQAFLFRLDLPIVGLSKLVSIRLGRGSLAGLDREGGVLVDSKRQAQCVMFYIECHLHTQEVGLWLCCYYEDRAV